MGETMDFHEFNAKSTILQNKLVMLWAIMWQSQKDRAPARPELFEQTLKEINRLHSELFGFGLYDDGARSWIEGQSTNTAQQEFVYQWWKDPEWQEACCLVGWLGSGMGATPCLRLT